MSRAVAEKSWRREELAGKALYFVGGFGPASFGPLIPLLKARLDILEDVLGLLILCVGIGGFLAMPIAGNMAASYGCRRVLTAAGLCYSPLLLVLCRVDNIWLAAATLLCFGALMGFMDVTLNIQAIMVEKFSGRQIMGGMHAMWSVGGLAGAGAFGFWTGACGLTPWESTLIGVVLGLTLVAVAQRYCLTAGPEKTADRVFVVPQGPVLIIGGITFFAFMIEGAMLDWSGVYLVNVRGLAASQAGMGFSVFSLAMLVMRFLSDGLALRLGRWPLIFTGGIVSITGLLTIIGAPWTPLMYGGFFVTGLGLGHFVPVFFSLLGKQDVMAVGQAVSAAATMGYLGVLVGPALLGFVARHTGLEFCYLLLAALMAVMMVMARRVIRQLA